MTTLTCKERLEYFSFYIAGSHDVDIPANHRGGALAATHDCINVGCRCWPDAEIEIVLGDESDFAPGGDPALDMRLRTPDNKLLLFDANHPELLGLAVEAQMTRIRVWINHETEPDHIVIIAGD